MADLHSLAHDIYSLISKHDLDGFMELVAEDMVEHEDLPFPEAPEGKAGVRALFQSMFDAFPDFEIEVLSMDGPRIDTVRVSPRASVNYGAS